MNNIVVCIAGYLAATLITFSQTTEKPVAEKAAAPIKLPADNVELVEVNGTTITATVLSMAADKLSIVIRTKDGAEIPILMSRLDEATIEKLTGTPLAKTPVKNGNYVLQEQQHKESVAAAYKALQETEKLPAKELHALYVNKDPRVMPRITHWMKYWEDRANIERKKDPNWDRYNVNPWTVLPLMDVKADDVEEQVSLRAEFERVGVKPSAQNGPDSCSLYSTYHIAQYAFLKKGITPPTVQQIKEGCKPYAAADSLAKGKFPREFLMRSLAKSSTTPPTGMWLELGSQKMFQELVKHQLRNKKACSAATFNEGKYHAIIVIAL